MMKVMRLVWFTSRGFKICILFTLVRGTEVVVTRIQYNISRCSSLLMSDCGLLLELSSSHCGNYVGYSILSLQNTAPSEFFL